MNAAIKITMLMTCACLKGPIMRLSVLRPSTKNLSKEYSMKYRHIICPLKDLFLFEKTIRKTNSRKHQMDS